MVRDEPFAFLDDGSGAGVRLFTGFAGTLACNAPEEAGPVLDAIEAAAGRGLAVVLLADYELGFLLEPRVLGRPYRPDTPPLTALLFERMESLDREASDAWLARRLAQLPADAQACGVADVRAGLDQRAHAEGVARIRHYIAEGDCYQVNYTFPLHFRHYGHPLALYARLRRRQPTRYGGFVALPGRSILSLSPELFLERHAGRLTSKPMKGTAPRGASSSEDALNRERLAASEKDRAENLMIVDLIRNDLGRIARPGTVSVERLFDIEEYPTVWQMTSTVSAQAPGASLADTFRALFPCGSITGAPKIRSMQIIDELESGPRGIYTGAIGYLAPGREMLLNVAIRTLVLDADGRGRMGVGSGIVYDSDAAAEYAECLWKARFLTELEGDFELIETLLCERGVAERFPLLALHLERLQDSARYFGIPCDAGAIRREIEQLGRELPAGERYRVRLLLARDGGFRIEPHALEDAAPTPQRVALAAKPVDSRDPFLYHKTTRRQRYDKELALAMQEGLFDVLFRNERGELTEGARTNLFLAFGDELHTPPVTAGLLNGVMRRHLLARQQPRVIERTLHEDDLRRADRIYAANAVRGLVPVELVEQDDRQGRSPTQRDPG